MGAVDSGTDRPPFSFRADRGELGKATVNVAFGPKPQVYRAPSFIKTEH